MLNGSLDTVALPDVLRLIASSGKSGLLRVDNASPSGRIFIVDGKVAFATTRDEDDPIDDLLHMEYRVDYVGSLEDRRIVDLNDLLENNPEAFHRFLEQMVVEVMSRLLRVDEGQFRFDVDIRSKREIPHSFGVEEMISQASARSDAWTRIFEKVPSASALFRIAPRLGEADEIILGRRDWALLAATGASTSIAEIAKNLRIFEFAAAKKVAELAERGLIEFINTEVSHTSMEATELLSGVAEAEPAEVADPDERSLETDAPTEVITFEDPPAPDPASDGAPKADSEGPTWVSVDEGHEDDEDPGLLLEELHRLHEAEAAAARQTVDHAEEDQEEEEEEEEDAGDEESVDEEVDDIDDIDGGDLATRWKNLRKAKRGAHVANE